MYKRLLSVLTLCLSIQVTQAQLADGSIAPDFTLTDINGNTVNLYQYLDDGKVVYLDIFAAHCPVCWSYHNTHALQDLYNDHGPAGAISDEVMVIAIEHDAGNNTNTLNGIGPGTAGNWVYETPYPICNPEGADRSEFISDYMATYYPMIYAICPDRKITLVGTQTASDLYNHVSTCAVSVEENLSVDPFVFFDANTCNLHLEKLPEGEWTLQVTDIQGKQVWNHPVIESTINFINLNKGLYTYTLHNKSRKLYRGKFVR